MFLRKHPHARRCESVSASAKRSECGVESGWNRMGLPMWCGCWRGGRDATEGASVDDAQLPSRGGHADASELDVAGSAAPAEPSRQWVEVSKDGGPEDTLRSLLTRAAVLGGQGNRHAMEDNQEDVFHWCEAVRLLGRRQEKTEQLLQKALGSTSPADVFAGLFYTDVCLQNVQAVKDPKGKSSKPVYSFLSAICDDSWTATIKSLARAPVVRTQLVASALRQYLPQWTRLVDASLRIGAATRARTKATFDEVLRAVPVSDVLSFAGGLHHSVAYALPGSGAGLQLQQEPQQQLEQVSDEEQLRLRAVRRQEAIEAALQAEATMIARAHEEDIQVATQMSIEEQLSRPPEELFPGDSDADYAAVLELSRREAEQAQPHLPPATGAVSVGTLNLDFKTVPLAADDAGFHSARTNGTGFESARSKLNPGLYSARSTASSLKIPSQPKAEPRARSSSEAPLYSARSTAESLKTPSRQVSAQKSAAGPSARSSAEAPLYSARSTASSVKAPNRQESASAQRAAGPRARNSQEAPAPAYMPPWFQEGGTDKFHDAEDVELKLEAVSSSPRVVARSSTREIQPASDEEEVFLSGSDDDFKSVHSHQTEASSMRSARSHLTAASRSIRGGSYSSQR